MNGTPAQGGEPAEKLRGSGRRSNWNRWGTEDQIGMLNLASSPHAVMSALTLVQSGLIVPLGMRVGGRKTAEPVWPGRIPSQRYMVKDYSHYQAGIAATPLSGACFASDVVTMPLHGTTHLDALGHAWSDGVLYNGVSAEMTVGFLRHADIAGISEQGLVISAVLVDLVDHDGQGLGATHVVTIAEIENRMHKQGVEVPTGGALLLRTGWLEDGYYKKAQLEQNCYYEEPGLDSVPEVVDYFADNDIVLLGTDTLGNERTKAPEADDYQALHARLIRDLGVLFLEGLDLKSVANMCREREQYQFCLVIAPLKLEGATGSPVNPLAIF